MHRWTFALALATSLACDRFDEPCPSVDAVDVEGGAAWNGQDSALTITGSDFQALPRNLSEAPGAAVPEAWLEADPRVELDVVWVDSGALAAVLPATDPPVVPGTYGVTVVNPGGCADTLADALVVTEQSLPWLDDSIRVDAVTPPFGWTEEPTAVTISGEGFVSTPRAWLDLDGDDGEATFAEGAELANVGFVDSGSLVGVVPAGLPVGGPYDLIVLNPDDGYNLLPAAFTVTADPPPDVHTVLPEAGSTQEDTELSIDGEHFVDGATVVLIDAAGTQTEATVTDVQVDHIDATAPSSAMSVGAYLVRVENPDGSYDDHAAFVVRNPSAKLGTAGAWGAAEPLETGRAGLGLVATTDELGRAFLYAVGGEDSDGAALASVELAAVDAFGTVAPWTHGVEPMNTPRAHAAVVALDGWLWAIGGDDGGGPLDTVERAAFLVGDAGARPTITSAEPTEGGSLPAGAWAYRVAAVMGEDDPTNPGGETRASEVAVARLAGDVASVALAWDGVDGAESYRVYRTDEADGVVGQEHRIAEGITDLAWTDAGEPAGTEAWVPEGGLGVWQTLDETLPAPLAHGAAVVVLDPVGDAFIYVVGGTTDGDAPVADVVALDPSGGWFVAGTLATARMDHGVALAGPDQAVALGEDSPTFLVAVEGDDGGGPTNDCELAEVLVGGDLSDFTVLSRLDAGGQARQDLHGLVAAGWVYILGGGGGADAAEATGRQAEVLGPGLDLGSWSSTSDSGTLAVPRADFGLTSLRAMLYAAGGRTDGDRATVAVEQVVY